MSWKFNNFKKGENKELDKGYLKNFLNFGCSAS